MDVKDLRTETALSERNNDGSKYSQGGVALPCRTKLYQDIGSNPLAKTEPTPVRPCAVIGPDRVIPPPVSNDAFPKKGSVELWPSPDNLYRRPHEYPHKLINGNQNPTRNISPRQTFQEHMQRITVPPTYSAVRHSDDANFSHVQDRNVAMPKNIKPNVPLEPKYCEMPYGINTTKEPKNIRDNELYMQSVNSVLTRSTPHGLYPAGVSVHAPRNYGAHELYQYPYQSCAGQRPTVIPLPRPQRTLQEEPTYAYSDHYQDASSHYKAFPTMKDRYPQGRYECYPSQFHPPPLVPPQKYDIPKPGQPHPYPMYSHLKYLDNRLPDHNIEGFQRPTNQQPHYNVQYRNQVIQPTYAPVPGNSSQNKLHPYPPDGATKTIAPNKLPYDSNSKMLIDYDNSRTKAYPLGDNYFVNEMGRVHPVKNQMVMPNYPPIGMHGIPSQQYYRKDMSKPFDYIPHYRNYDPTMNNPMMRHAPQFSPNTLAISPSDSSTSNETSLTHGTSLEDCGYVSQSSTTSMRSIDSGIYRLPHEYYKRYDFRYGHTVQSSPTLTKPENSSNSNSKESKQKDINVRQFFQMWNEDVVEDENSANNNSKDIVIRTSSSETSNFSKQHSKQDQLYVLGLVNVPSEELSKYEHIQKISKLPENIKGYNTLELLSQFEEAIESSNAPNFKSISKEYQMSSKVNSPKQVGEVLPRPVSPLDVEAKISQSVIHKEVGCNFEIRPCSPKMLNVEVAAPAQNVLGELMIEKVKNPLSNVKSPNPIKHDDNSNCHPIRIKENSFEISENPSCKMIRSPFTSSNMDSVKTNYSLQDLEINSGVCLASLPRLDNEIELHFPEVNQQFINANKKDEHTTLKSSTPKNSEEDFGFSDEKSVKKDKEKCESGIMGGDDCQKMYTKLSKYRKIKTSTNDHSENYHQSQVVRTDSVIIKNPENLKNIEDKLLESSLSTPMNLSSQSSVCCDSPKNISENSNKDLDVALDFSLNKSAVDLPIIITENDELTKSFDANSPYMPYNNISTTDSIDSCIKKTRADENVSYSKNTTSSCRHIEPDEGNLKNNDNAMQIELDLKNSKCTIPVQEPIFQSKDNHTITFDNACDSVSVSGNSSLCSANIEDANDRKFNEVTELQTQGEQYDSCKNSINNNVDNKGNASDTAPQNMSSKCAEIDSADKQVVEESISQNEVTNINDDDTKNENKFVTSSQTQNDFENDEISASLEKLFRDSDDDLTEIDNDNDSTAKRISLPLKVQSYHRSKELFSPRIQKLLTHSEGSCSKSDRENKEKKSLKSILNDSEDISEELQHDTSNVEHSHNMEVDVEYDKMFLTHTSENEHFEKKSLNNSFPETLCLTELQDSFKTFRHNDADTDCITKNESKALDKTKRFSNEEKSSVECMDVDDICSTNLELNANSTPSYSKECISKLLEGSKSESDILKSNTDIESNAELVQNEHEKFHKTNSYVPYENPSTVCEPDSIVEEDLNPTLERKSDFVSNDSVETHSKSNQGIDSIGDNNENIICTNGDLEKEDSNRQIQKLDNGGQVELISTCLEEDSNSASGNCIRQKNEKLFTSESSTENVNNLDNDTTASDVSNNEDVVSEFDNMIQDNFNNNELKNNDQDANESFSEDKIESLSKGETLTASDKSSVHEVVDVYQKVESLLCASSDSGQSNENQKPESEEKISISLPGNETNKTIEIEYNKRSDILPSAMNKILLQSSLDVDSNNCTLFQTLEIHSGDNLVRDKTDCEFHSISEEKIMSENDCSPTSVSCTQSNLESGKSKDFHSEIADCDEAISSHGSAYSLIRPNDSCEHTPNSISELRTQHTKYKTGPLHESSTVTDVLTVHINSNINNTSDCNTSDTCSISLYEHSDVVTAIANTYVMDENKSNCDIENTVPDCFLDTQLDDHPEEVNKMLQETVPATSTASACINSIQDDAAENIVSNSMLGALNEETNVVKDPKARFLIDTDEVNICYQVVDNDEMQVESNQIHLDSQDISIQNPPQKRRLLKRSYSDSALNCYKNGDGNDRQATENTPFTWPSKRQRMYEIEHSEQHVMDESLCNLIQNNRRNSVSAFCNEQNVSFCILIDNNCLLTEENEDEKICFAEVSEDCIAEINTDNEEDIDNDVICCSQEDELDVSETIVLNYDNEKSIQESWLDNVACVETVVSEDVEDDDIIGDHTTSLRDIEISEYDESGIYSCDLSDHPDEVSFLNDDNVCDIVAQNVEICRSPSVPTEEFKLTTNNNLVDIDCSKTKVCTKINFHVDNDSDIQNTDEICANICDHITERVTIEEIILEPTLSRERSQSPHYSEMITLPESTNTSIPENKENIFKNNVSLKNYESDTVKVCTLNDMDKKEFCKDIAKTVNACHTIVNNDVDSCESSKDDLFNYTKPQNDEVSYSTSSSPEVSSTTFEEKGSSILLKITNFNGSRVSEINEVKHNKPRCKFTEKKEYSNSYGIFPKRPLLTKAAQKYIPPLKESICDLKVKLTLPQQRLLKLKQLKLSRSELKQTSHSTNITTIMTSKKPKPNFEDVLKSIDEVQIKKLKEKNKKAKNVIPKVVIKKNLNGSHYTSSSNKDKYNPDLTGRKWQPWVFLEKNHFIDQMAIRNKTKAIYNHRNNKYVLAEKFKKYKSVSNCSAKFVISQPKINDSSKGQLKYTIRLKHSY